MNQCIVVECCLQTVLLCVTHLQLQETPSPVCRTTRGSTDKKLNFLVVLTYDNIMNQMTAGCNPEQCSVDGYCLWFCYWCCVGTLRHVEWTLQTKVFTINFPLIPWTAYSYLYANMLRGRIPLLCCLRSSLAQHIASMNVHICRWVTTMQWINNFDLIAAVFRSVAAANWLRRKRNFFSSWKVF